ncbi:MAG: molybdopterin converting factor subunit 1 [Acidobacteriota bacterium]
MKVHLLFFAVLRDMTGTGQKDLVLEAGTTARQVWQSLRAQYGQLAAFTQPPMVAINESYAAPDTVLRDGDQLAFIPPVAGG